MINSLMYKDYYLSKVTTMTTMKFIVSQDKLLQALHRTRNVWPNKSNKLFDSFFFTFTDDQRDPTMTVHASDGSVWMTETISLDANPSDPRPIAIGGEYLISVIESLESQPLEFVVAESQLTVRYSKGSFRLPLDIGTQEFLEKDRPSPNVEAADGYVLKYLTPELCSILQRCSFAMACDDLCPPLMGVYVNLTDNFSEYVASDGHKLVRVRKDAHPSLRAYSAAPLSFIIPAQVVHILLRILPGTLRVTFQYQKDNASARIVIDNKITLAFHTTKCIYPNYCSVIPEHHTIEMIVNRKQLIESVSRLTFFTSDAEMITMNVTKESLHLNATDTDYEMQADEYLPCKARMHDGTFMTALVIGLRATTLEEALKALSSEEVLFHFTSFDRPIIFYPYPQPHGSEEITMLIMPMLVNN